MKLPDTLNASHQLAFKKGYRLALEDKPLSAMPNNFRFDPEMQEYFQLGWQQAEDEKNITHKNANSPWHKHKIKWLILLLASLVFLTIIVILNKEPIEQPDPSQIAPPATAPTVAPAITNLPIVEMKLQLSPPVQTMPTEEHPNEQKSMQEVIPPLYQEDSTEYLTLKNIVQDKKEEEEQKEKKLLNPIPQPVFFTNNSDVRVEVANLSYRIEDKEPVNILVDIVPKHINRVYFFTKITGAESEIIYHRWIYKNKTLAMVALHITSSPFRTWSSKGMNNDRQGEWTVEVLDQEKTLIYRQHFRYIE